MVNKIVPRVIDVKLLFIFIIVVGVVYFHSLCLPLVVRAEDANRLTRKRLLMGPVFARPVLQSERDKEYRHTALGTEVSTV